MNKLVKEQKNNRVLYRELFLKASESIKKQLQSLKSISFCKKCKTCCKLRYALLSPADISVGDDKISEEYMRLFLPYGSDENFDYESNNEIDINKNHAEAQKIDADYVNLITSKVDEPVYFYRCKHFEDNQQCSAGKTKNFLCTNFPQSITTVLPKDCGHRQWQELAVNKIKNDIAKDIIGKLKEIDVYRQSFSCKNCGICCKLACSEFSYEELKQKAKNNDNFATQFISVFVPYKDIEEPRNVFPEYVDMVLANLQEDEKVYFYHCPDVTEDNLCPKYEQRPDICRVFPDNPLTILPSPCGFYEWKEEVHVASMLLHALVEISDFQLKKIEQAL